MPAKKRSVEWFKKGSGSLNEIYQQTGILFAFLSSPKDGNRQCHEWVKCRDYLHDAVRTTLTGNDSHIFGFQFKRGDNPDVDIRKMRMLVTKNGLTTPDKRAEFSRKMKASLVLLNHFEKQAAVALSTLKEVDTTGTKKQVVFLFTGSAIWMKSPFLVSMYTYLIRLGDKEMKFKNAAQLRKEMKRMVDAAAKGEKPYSGDNDVTYLKTMWQHLHTVMKERNRLFVKKDGFDEVFFQNTSINNFHNSGGILSLVRAKTPNTNLNSRVNKILHAK